MKIGSRLNRVAVGTKGWALAVLVGWLAGCGGERPEVAQAPDPGIAPQGEPIRGEPIGATAEVRDAVQGAPAASVAGPTSSSPSGSTATATALTTGKATASVAALGTAAPVAEVTALPSATESGRVALSAVASAAEASPGGGAVAGAVSLAAKGAGTPTEPLTLGFDRLSSFKYDLPDGPVDTNVVTQVTAPSQIPESIRALNNQFVALKGYMLPLKVEKGLVTEMLILRDQSMCCYGAVPRINEWVSVKMVSAGAKPVMDQAVTLFGRLKVGEMYENGYLVGIYAIDGDRVAGPLDM